MDTFQDKVRSLKDKSLQITVTGGTVYGGTIIDVGLDYLVISSAFLSPLTVRFDHIILINEPG